MASNSDALLGKIISDALYGFGAALIIAGIMIFCYQYFRWYHDGLWQDVSFGGFWLSNGGRYPASLWWNIDRAVVWLFRQPLSAVSFVAGLLVISVRDRRRAH